LGREVFMIITFYIFISWLLLSLIIFNQIHHKDSIKEVSLVLFLGCIINTHSYAGLFDTLNWLKSTTDSKLFIALLIFKNVFVPLLLSCFTLLIDRHAWNKKLLYFSLFSLIILVIDLLNLSRGIYSFNQWNHFHTFIYYLICISFLLFTLKWFRGLDPDSGGGKNAVD
jgi:hypothetical protein